MATILDDILAHKRLEVAAQRQRVDMDTLVANISASNDTPRGFMKALQARVAIGGTAVIAEVKKASPSMGVIRASFDPVTIAESYAAAIFYVAGAVADLAEGVARARAIMREGQATAQLERIAACSQRLREV